MLRVGKQLRGRLVTPILSQNFFQNRNKFNTTNFIRNGLVITVASVPFFSNFRTQSHKERSQQVIYGIISINTVVFILWQIARRNANLLIFMNKHFVCSVPQLRSMRLHTLVTHMFSHVTLFHFIANNYALVCKQS